MIGSVPPAFIQAELDYRVGQIKAGYPRTTRSVRQPRRHRFVAVLSWARRPWGQPSEPVTPSISVRAGYSR
jgi:hypothetical protein